MLHAVDDIKTVGIVGAGTMGLGIAQVCAAAGFKTALFDINEEALKDAEKSIISNFNKGIEKGKVTESQKEEALSNLSFITEINDLRADLIIEAVLEKLEVKQKLFQQLEDINSTNTILATNTSSIPITKIASTLAHPERVVGVHFFNPAHIMKLVEVIAGSSTEPHVLDVTKAFVERLDKTPVLAKDSPGFIVNRVARHFYVESLKIIEEGVSDVEGVDRLMEASGFRMGPFRLMDLIGVDTNFSVTQSMYEAFYYNAKFRPNRIQEQKVNAGHNGRKSGKGFYNYE
ncbi:3-hydroxyacyl-CoA dehydrogenase NAD-binding domain-containing protein [Fulvivirga maritima]|uniref:3-hydroxyacyl-CoA dehydrogenase NAD-binding domain-containing protein n=1 Tax=Fulvivirga maritima TaxID=2904247 RepID=UPI001F3758D3|nr:3-hydroxyacyl-CoA dehydrogenase NAD-binding domain-containing protein [Fulvivirga maritima]UII27937.1 3-hydroxyacyl-CoA dehydrogenase NAD-binding domain-containing protein [Fulvivirga maritima]